MTNVYVIIDFEIKGKNGVHMIIKTRTNVYDFNFHLVFVTKYRQHVFNSKEKQQSMTKTLQHICDIHNIIIQELEVMSDHIHLLISFNPKHAPSSIVKTIKGHSAREWFKQYPQTKKDLWKGHLWSPSFFMSTVGNMSKDIVKKYIENQVSEYNGGRLRS